MKEGHLLTRDQSFLGSSVLSTDSMVMVLSEDCFVGWRRAQGPRGHLPSGQLMVWAAQGEEGQPGARG